MAERLYLNEFYKPFTEQNRITLQCCELLKINPRLTALELRGFLLPAPSDSGIPTMVCNGRNWFRQNDHLSLLDRLENERYLERLNNDDDSSDDEPFRGLKKTNEIYRRNRDRAQRKKNEATCSRQKSRSRSRSPLFEQRYINVREFHMRNEIRRELIDEFRAEARNEALQFVRSQLEPIIREEIEQDSQSKFEAHLDRIREQLIPVLTDEIRAEVKNELQPKYEARLRNAIAEFKNRMARHFDACKKNIIDIENKRKDDEMHEKLRELVNREFVIDEQYDNAITDCPVCLLPSMNRRPVLVECCGHITCIFCFWNCMKVKKACPKCRQQIHYRNVRILKPELRQNE